MGVLNILQRGNFSCRVVLDDKNLNLTKGGVSGGSQRIPGILILIDK